jgi:hypothetical protein
MRTREDVFQDFQEYTPDARIRVYDPGGSLGVEVGNHVRKLVSKLDPFQDLTFEKNTPISGPAEITHPYQDAPNHNTSFYQQIFLVRGYWAVDSNRMSKHYS